MPENESIIDVILKDRVLLVIAIIALLLISGGVLALLSTSPELPIPSNVSAVVNGSLVYLHWSSVQGTIDGYVVYRSDTLGVIGDEIGRTNDTNFTDEPGYGRFYYLVRTFKGDAESANTEQVVVDVVPPAPENLSIDINNGSNYTNITSVTLYLHAEGAEECRYSNDGLEWTEWETYMEERPWQLAEGPDGNRTVYYQCRYMGSESEVVSDTIFYDSTAPSVGFSYELSGNDMDLFPEIIDESPVFCIAYAGDVVVGNFPGDTEEVILTLPDGTYYFSLVCTDAAGNTGEAGTLLEGVGSTTNGTGENGTGTQPPTEYELSVLINNGHSVTDSRNVELKVTHNGWATECRFANEDDYPNTWTAWQPYQRIVDWRLSSGEGLKVVYVQCKNADGSVVRTASDSIRYREDNQPPTPDYYTLYLTKTIGGSVTGALNCLPGDTSCFDDFEEGSTQSLNAQECVDYNSEAWVFSSWYGDCSGSSLTCSVLMSQDRDVQGAWLECEGTCSNYSNCEPYCGDGICDTVGGENETTCPEDCQPGNVVALSIAPIGYVPADVDGGTNRVQVPGYTAYPTIDVVLDSINAEEGKIWQVPEGFNEGDVIPGYATSEDQAVYLAQYASGTTQFDLVPAGAQAQNGVVGDGYRTLYYKVRGDGEESNIVNGDVFLDATRPTVNEFSVEQGTTTVNISWSVYDNSFEDNRQLRLIRIRRCGVPTQDSNLSCEDVGSYDEETPIPSSSGEVQLSYAYFGQPYIKYEIIPYDLAAYSGYSSVVVEATSNINASVDVGEVRTAYPGTNCSGEPCDVLYSNQRNMVVYYQALNAEECMVRLGTGNQSVTVVSWHQPQESEFEGWYSDDITLVNVPGDQSIEVICRNGDVVDTGTDHIVYDPEAPQGEITASSVNCRDETIDLWWVAYDTYSGIDHYKVERSLRITGDVNVTYPFEDLGNYSTSVNPFEESNIVVPDGVHVTSSTYTYRFTFYDTAGNFAEDMEVVPVECGGVITNETSVRILRVGLYSPANGVNPPCYPHHFCDADYSASKYLQVYVEAVNASSCRLGHDANGGVVWDTNFLPYDASSYGGYVYYVPGSDGVKTVYVECRNDSTYDYSNIVSDSIMVDTTPPVLVSLIAQIFGNPCQGIDVQWQFNDLTQMFYKLEREKQGGNKVTIFTAGSSTSYHDTDATSGTYRYIVTAKDRVNWETQAVGNWVTCQAGGYCGDGTCDVENGENYNTCPQDCEGVCGDGVCDSTEDANSCPADCSPGGGVVCDTLLRMIQKNVNEGDYANAGWRVYVYKTYCHSQDELKAMCENEPVNCGLWICHYGGSCGWFPGDGDHVNVRGYYSACDVIYYMNSHGWWGGHRYKYHFCEVCGDGVCGQHEDKKNDNFCLDDCGLKFCGDGVCDTKYGENSINCPQDCADHCYCGDGICDMQYPCKENKNTCPEDCKFVPVKEGKE